MGSPYVYVVSGGSGASGDQLVQTALAQFPNHTTTVRIFSNIREKGQVDEIIRSALRERALVVHTLVNQPLFDYFTSQADEAGISHLDMMQVLLRELSAMIGDKPLGHPGLYRKLHKDYFDRIAAIEYTMAHDDGKDPDRWVDAEIVITGISRVGKTPLSMYLSVLGWKVANVPLILSLPPHPKLFDLDRRRLIGLTMHPGQLIIHRQHRLKRIGAAITEYANPQHVHEEVKHFEELLHANNVFVIDVTDKPIETTADEVIKHVQH